MDGLEEVRCILESFPYTEREQALRQAMCISLFKRYKQIIKHSCYGMAYQEYYQTVCKDIFWQVLNKLEEKEFEDLSLAEEEMYSCVFNDTYKQIKKLRLVNPEEKKVSMCKLNILRFINNKLMNYTISFEDDEYQRRYSSDYVNTFEVESEKGNFFIESMKDVFYESLDKYLNESPK